MFYQNATILVSHMVSKRDSESGMKTLFTFLEIILFVKRQRQTKIRYSERLINDSKERPFFQAADEKHFFLIIKPGS